MGARMSAHAAGIVVANHRNINDLTTTFNVQNDRNHIKRREAGFSICSSKLGNQFVSEICKTDARDCSRKR
jgi:hypothetical protein